MRDQTETDREADRPEDIPCGKNQSASDSLAAGLVAEVFKTQAFKDIARIWTRDIKPSNARALINRLIWEDMEISMGVAVSLPMVAAYFKEALSEGAEQFFSLPSELRKNLLSGMAQDMPQNTDSVKWISEEASREAAAMASDMFNAGIRKAASGIRKAREAPKREKSSGRAASDRFKIDRKAIGDLICEAMKYSSSGLSDILSRKQSSEKAPRLKGGGIGKALLNGIAICSLKALLFVLNKSSSKMNSMNSSCS